MPPSYSRILPWLLAALLVWVAYRRFRRTFGPQLLRPGRMLLRMGLLAVLALSLAPAAWLDRRSLVAQVLGLALGIALALWGASRTRFVESSRGLLYVPHTRTGIAVSSLVLGRLAYRAVEIYLGGESLQVAGAPDARSAIMHNPPTLGLLFALVGYYLGYYGWVLWKSRRITAADLEPPAPPKGGASDASPGQVEKRDGQQTGAGQQHVVAPTGDQTQHSSSP